MTKFSAIPWTISKNSVFCQLGHWIDPISFQIESDLFHISKGIWILFKKEDCYDISTIINNDD
jgi:hypothetical protein